MNSIIPDFCAASTVAFILATCIEEMPIQMSKYVVRKLATILSRPQSGFNSLGEITWPYDVRKRHGL